MHVKNLSTSAPFPLHTARKESSMKRFSPLLFAALLLPLASCATLELGDSADLAHEDQALATGSTVIPATGQPFEIAITSPSDGDVVPLGPVAVTGTVAIGGVAGTPVNVISVADLSGSTQSPSNMDCSGDGAVNAGDDFNGDGRPGDVLDCEISGIIALNQSLFGTVNVDVGLVAFGQDAATVDIKSAAGDQAFTSPPEADLDSNGRADHEDVARGLRVGQITRYTPKAVGTWTHFDRAIAAMNAAFAGQPAGERNIAFFLSDGNPGCSGAACGGPAYTGLAGPLGTARANGTIINTFTVGINTAGCAAGAPMREIADATGGTCTEVDDPSALANALPGMVPSGIDRVEVNGVSVHVDAVGNFDAELVCTSGAVLPIEAIGYADDSDATTVLANIAVTCCTDTDDDGNCDDDDVCPLDPANDADADGVCGDVDNCPATANADRADADGDGAGDACDPCASDADDDADGDGVCGDIDNCPASANADQADADGDGLGGACDVCALDPANDADADGVCGNVDNCPAIANADQADSDGDRAGDACDVCPLDPANDADADGVCGNVDNCPAIANADQADSDGDRAGDACDVCPLDPANDADADGVCGDVDNCPANVNVDQADVDADGAGDACDVCPLDPANDADADRVCGDVDNCPAAPNADQADSDGDGPGDACDVCPLDAANDADGDGVCGDVDNCLGLANTDQLDRDGDGAGDACDVCPLDAANDADGDGVCGDVDLCAGTTIPEAVPTNGLGVNRFALVDGDGVFDTVLPTGSGPGRSYTIADTRGCSCAQIIAARNLGAGHRKFGCSISAMDDWIAALP
jgi:hypothetical protein